MGSGPFAGTQQAYAATLWACNIVDMISGGKSQNLISACGKIPCAPALLGSHHVGGGVSNQSVAVAGDGEAT